MAERSAIAWCRSTFNPWIGCTKISPGCDNCYAEALDKRRWSKTLGGGTKVIPISHWGPGAPRYRTSKKYWSEPLKWNLQAPDSEFNGRKGFWPVFCASQADVFDNEVPIEWLRDLCSLIELTPNLTWLLVTKRIGNVMTRLIQARSHDWLAGQKNVVLLITVVNQAEADRDIPKLLATPATKRGISYEPALGPVQWPGFNAQSSWCPRCSAVVRDGISEIHEFAVHKDLGLGKFDPAKNCAAVYDMLHWIIVGGESAQDGAPARPFNVKWAIDTIRQCKAAGVPVFVKQMGSMPFGFPVQSRIGDPIPDVRSVVVNGVNKEFGPAYKDRAGADPAEWPEHLRVQEFPL